MIALDCDCLTCDAPFCPAISGDAFTCAACVASSPYRAADSHAAPPSGELAARAARLATHTPRYRDRAALLALLGALALAAFSPRAPREARVAARDVAYQGAKLSHTMRTDLRLASK